MLWDSHGNVFNLNALIDPNSGWSLEKAYGISDTNWVSGYGLFYAGPLAGAYERTFLLNVSSILPDPANVFLLAAVTALLCQRRRATNSSHGFARCRGRS